jgi:hypothetical protein
MKKTTKVLVGVLVAVVVAGVALFAANPGLMKGYNRIGTSGTTGNQAATIAGNLCPSSSSLVFSPTQPGNAEYKDYSSLYDAVKTGTLKDCAYSLYVSVDGVKSFQNAGGGVNCKAKDITVSSANKTLRCEIGNSEVILGASGASFVQKFDDGSHFNINSNTYTVMSLSM